MLRLVAKKIVYEYDDAVYLPSPAEPQGESDAARYRRNFSSTAAVADLVVVGNHHLAAQIDHPRIEIVPTGVDLSIFKPNPGSGGSDGCVLGWIGTEGNLPQWERLLPVFKRVVAEKPEVRFKVVSNGESPQYALPLEFERFTIEREAACLADFDIGLMPLQDTPWNRGKCAYKALQCMAMGLPVVVSPVGMNLEVIEPGVSGEYAATEDEWVDRLLRLAGDAELRLRMGRAARTVVEERYSLESAGTRIADLIDGLVG